MAVEVSVFLLYISQSHSALRAISPTDMAFSFSRVIKSWSIIYISSVYETRLGPLGALLLHIVKICLIMIMDPLNWRAANQGGLSLGLGLCCIEGSHTEASESYRNLYQYIAFEIIGKHSTHLTFNEFH